MNLPPNIPSEPQKPSLTPKFERRNTERGLLPVFKIPEDSDTGTDNAMQGIKKLSARVSDFTMNESKEPKQISPRTRAWKPRLSDERGDDEVLQLQKPPTTPGRTRFSKEVEIRDLSSDDSETTSRRSFSRLKKKRKKRTSRHFSDSDGV